MTLAEAETEAERDKRLAAAGEANALNAINASQRAQLDELLRTALAPPPSPKKHVPATPPPTKAVAKQFAPRRKNSPWQFPFGSIMASCRRLACRTMPRRR